MNNKTPEVELLPCPFCGCALEANWNRVNPKARCRTVDCMGSKLPVLNLDQPEAIAAWNRRAADRKLRPGNAEMPEPVAFLSVDCIGERYLCFTKPDDDDPLQALYTADQVQAMLAAASQPLSAAVEIEGLHNALEELVSCFDPYAWGSETNRADALQNARAAIAKEKAK